MLLVVAGAWMDAVSMIETLASCSRTNNILDAIMSARHFGIITGGSDHPTSHCFFMHRFHILHFLGHFASFCVTVVVRIEAYR